MQKIKVLFVVFCTTLLFSTAPVFANGCAVAALNAAKAAGGNTTTLKQLYNTYLGEPFARHVAGASWNSPSFDKQAQVERAQSAILTLAHHLAPYADASFSWKGNIGTFVHGTERGVITVFPTGKGCLMADICMKDKGCLSSYIPKMNMTAQK